MVTFEREIGSADGNVTVCFESWKVSVRGILTWNALVLEPSKRNTFIRPVAREIWEDLVRDGFTTEYSTAF